MNLFINDVCKPIQDPPKPQPRRVPINIHPDVREALARLLYQPEMRGVGYSAFIKRAILLASAEIAKAREEEQAAERAMATTSAPKRRPPDCSNCGRSVRSHTGTYCQACGEPL